MSAIRPIAPMAMPGVIPGGDVENTARFSSVRPTDLLVDEGYQRNLTERSVQLIRRIVADWDWKAFKPPVVVETDAGLHVLDGQHTAIAAASHSGIAEIPVMIVEAARQEDRASAFVKHNRDRIQVTSTQLHFALVAAGDEEALTVEQVCRRAGARILRLPPSQGRFDVGDTMAIEAIRGMVRRRHAKGAREILEVCVNAYMAPVSAGMLKAVEQILFGADYAGQVAAADLTTTIREMGAAADRAAALFAAEHKVPIWRGLVITLFRNAKKVRRGLRTAA